MSSEILLWWNVCMGSFFPMFTLLKFTGYAGRVGYNQKLLYYTLTFVKWFQNPGVCQ